MVQTKQRQLILEAVRATNSHPTADELFQMIRRKLPTISLATVYRNLNLLVDLGEIRKLSCGSGPDRFDGDTSPHYHFVCRECGEVEDLPMEAFQDLNQAAQRYCSGRIDSHVTYFYGTCENCSKKSAQSA